MFIAVTQNSLVLLAASAAAELLVRGRWELVHKRAIRSKYAQGRIGQNSELF